MDIKQFALKEDDKEYTLQIVRSDDKNKVTLEMISTTTSKKYVADFTLESLTEFNKQFGFYDSLDELMFDLEETIKYSPDDISFGGVEQVMMLKMIVYFNSRERALQFKLNRTELTMKDKNKVLAKLNKKLRDELLVIRAQIERENKSIKEVEKENDQYDMIQCRYQWLKCWQCGANNAGEMIICKQVAEPGRNDEYSKNGYSALCQTHKNQEGTKPEYQEFSKKTMNEGQYQQLFCYQCGQKDPKKMLICENQKDGKTRNDRYGKDGYTALCPSCVDFLGQPGVNKKAFQYGE